MKLLVGIMVAAVSTIGCGASGAGKGAQALVGTTTITSAPVQPRTLLLPAVDWEDEGPVAPLVETWGVKPPTPEEIELYGF